jgi:hypothetical protein
MLGDSRDPNMPGLIGVKVLCGDDYLLQAFPDIRVVADLTPFSPSQEGGLTRGLERLNF